MTDSKCENFDIWYDEYECDDDRPFMYTCKLVCIDGDEAFGSLTKEEAKQIYEYLGKFFGKEDQG